MSYISIVTMLFTFINLALIILILRFLILGIKYFSLNIKKNSRKKTVRRSLGQVLKDLRTQNNMTQEFVAGKLGVSRQAVSKWENGTSEPSTTNLMSIAKLYGISVHELLSMVEA